MEEYLDKSRKTDWFSNSLFEIIQMLKFKNPVNPVRSTDFYKIDVFLSKLINTDKD